MRGGLDGECGHRAEGEGEEEWYDMRCMSCSSTVRPRSLFSTSSQEEFHSAWVR